MRRRASGRLATRGKLGALIGTIGAALLLGSCGGGQLEPVTKQGQGLHRLYLIMWVLAVIIFVGVEIAIWGFPIVFRRRRGDEDLPPQIRGNHILEAVWIGIPSIIVVTLFVLSFQQINKVQAREAVPAHEIKVIGKQWAWSFDYGNGVTVVGQNATKNTAGFSGAPVPPRLVVPVGENIEFKLQSDDVIHSFYIPASLYKLDVVPGQQNSFQVTFDKTSEDQPANGIYSAGAFQGACAELCGTQHAQMLFEVEVVSPEQFDTWLRQKQAAARGAGGGSGATTTTAATK